jgi:hypothetical protein
MTGRVARSAELYLAAPDAYRVTDDPKADG